MKIYLNNFFNDVDLSPFFILFKNVFNEDVETGTLENSDILFESVFGKNTLLYHKKWKYTFLFIGESDRRLPIFMSSRINNNTLKDYSCILKGELNNNNIVNFPLFVFYNYCFNFTYKFIKHYYEPIRFKNIINNEITNIPYKNICAIISNGNDSEGRNYFCHKLNEKVKIDYAGNYKNNVPKVNDFHCSPGFINFVSKYKFIICMENSKNKTYITEKILHGFAANTIPIYWGSDNITDYFNEERFINVKSFNDDEINKVIEKIILLINDDKLYLEMVNKPIYKNNELPISLNSISNDIKKLLNIKSDQYKKFITFGGPTENFYRSVNRICDEARNINFFNEIIGFTDKDLKNDIDFWKKHSEFILKNRRGYGYWVWKPYLIKKELEKLNENDILIYCDCGCEINKEGKQRLLEYIDLLNNNKENYGMISFQLEFKEFLYTKKAIFDFFKVEEKDKNVFQCIGGIQIIKKNKHSINIINEWEKASNNYFLINNNSFNEDSLFIENRNDQSLISVLVNKYGSLKLIDETYFSNWNDGKKYPFLAKRIK
jgi:hypothetical protein